MSLDGADTERQVEPADPLFPKLCVSLYAGAFATAVPCRAAAALVAARGAVVLGTGPHTYERIVLHGGLCKVEETTAPAWEPTADNPQWFVGYRCKDKFNEGSDAVK